MADTMVREEWDGVVEDGATRWLVNVFPKRKCQLPYISWQANQNILPKSPKIRNKYTKKFGSNQVRTFSFCPNVEPDHKSGSTIHPNLGPNFSPVRKS